MSNNSTYVYETYIRAPAERVWQALTSAEFTSQYFHATHVDSTWEPGAPVRYDYAPGGAVAVEGEVLEAAPPHKLAITWHVLYNEDAEREPASRVTFEIETLDQQTRLRIVHDRFVEGSVVQPEISKGWPWILSSLKSLLETGEALPPAAA